MFDPTVWENKMFDPTVLDYESGQICVKAGLYRFVGYSDRSDTPPPRQGRGEIWLSAGDLFPAIAEAGKTCFWTRVPADDLRDPRACTTGTRDH
jgi:glycine/D-amino acid oxidase-like deaminating enzyme